ncbi:hypothetical protein AMJ47_03150 [Parcubacteria bacterium DG_72]|nr:MAG: hypothetical protein AMJ47_03150 [Parcubacteria bacterium DG_72]
MPKFTIFEIFIIVHLIMDFIFQRQWEAAKKNKDWRALAFHCFIYTIGFVPVFWFLRISFWWLLLLFLSHFVIDNQKIVQWLLEKLKGYKQNKTNQSLWTLLYIGVDQTLHLIILLIIAGLA